MKRQSYRGQDHEARANRLREELDAERDAHAETKEERDRLKKAWETKPKPSPNIRVEGPRLFSKMSWPKFRLPRWRWPWDGHTTAVGFVIFTMIAVVVAAIVGVIHHQIYDIREGVVIDKDHHGQWVQVMSNGNGGTTTIVHPESWSVTIEAGDETAEWSVSEGMWQHLEFGDCYCAHDDQKDCVGCER